MPCRRERDLSIDRKLCCALLIFVRHPSVQWGTLWHSLYLHDKICHLHFVASLCTVLLQMFRGIWQCWLTWTVIHVLLACMDWTVSMKFDFAQGIRFHQCTGNHMPLDNSSSSVASEKRSCFHTSARVSPRCQIKDFQGLEEPIPRHISTEDYWFISFWEEFGNSKCVKLAQPLADEQTNECTDFYCSGFFHKLFLGKQLFRSVVKDFFSFFALVLPRMRSII